MPSLNKFKYSDDNKRYHTLNYFYKHKFNSKIFKVSLNAGFSCPNIDGTVGYGGCIYCSKSGSGEFAGKTSDDIVTQFNKVKNMMLKKWPNAKYIGYFQARTNTYAPVERLKQVYEPILKQEGVVGLNIGTRCDAISDECLDYLTDLNKRTYLTIELGLQTMHEKTSKLINRCHSLECFKDMVNKLREKNINVVVHIINGLPGESKEDMIETVKYLNNLDIQGIKIHMLSVLKNTPLEEYNKKKNELIQNHENELKTKIAFYGNDVLTTSFSFINDKFENAIFNVKSSYSFDDLYSELEEKITNNSLQYRLVFLFDKKANISSGDYKKIAELCKDYKIYICNTTSNNISVNLDNVTILDFYDDIKNNENYLMVDRVHLSDVGNEALAQMLYENIE